MPLVAQENVQIRGLRALQRGFREANVTLHRELQEGLKRAGEPVRVDAEVKAVRSIENIGLRWSRMKVGVRPGVVYVAPRERGSRGLSLRKRPNLANLLLFKAMQPALQQNLPVVERIANEVLDEVEKAWRSG